MNSFATLSLIYAVFTIVSSAILYSSFRKKIDSSAIYFLLSELCMASTCTVIFLINKKLILPGPIWTFIPNFSAMSAEIAIYFSVASLTRIVDKKWFLIGILGAAFVALLIEILRDYFSLQILVWIFAGTLTCLFITNYWACKFNLSKALSDNEFMKLFTMFELGMVCFGLIRISANFLPSPVLPRDDPSDIAVIIFSIYIVLGVLRYLSYLGIRITWVDPANPITNPLNKPLAQALEEKDRLVLGLAASNRVIGISALASSLAHQLSQPLTTIALRAATTRRALVQSGQDPKIIASIDEIANQSSKLSALVKNLRQFFESKRSNFSHFKLQDKIEEIIEIVEPNFAEKRIVLVKELHSDPIVFGDGIQIQQAFINVINNSIDALVQSSHQHREIWISLNQEESFATLTIKDNGGGIDALLIPNVFDLYKTSKKDGLGVGLWLSKTIMTQHQGTMTAHNEPNGWAVFKMTLPIHQSAQN